MQTRLLMALFIHFDLPGWDRVSFQSPVKITAVISRPDLHRWGSSTSHRHRSKNRPMAAPGLLLTWPRGSSWGGPAAWDGHGGTGNETFRQTHGDRERSLRLQGNAAKIFQAEQPRGLGELPPISANHTCSVNAHPTNPPSSQEGPWVKGTPEMPTAP